MRDIAARACAVVDNNLLAEAWCELGCGYACDQIICAAGGEADQKADGFGGVVSSRCQRKKRNGENEAYVLHEMR